MRQRLILLLAVLGSLAATAQVAPKTYVYAQKDTSTLRLDVYTPTKNAKSTTVVYVFGGGFVMGARDDRGNVAFYEQLVERGYKVIAIDYRLGLKGVKRVGALNAKAPFLAVKMAVEDLFSATDYIIKNHEMLGVDTSRIVLVGSSAGAITVLQGDYELTNRSALSAALPATFRYAGVVSMAGAIFSTEGRPHYKSRPAPTMMLHGTADKVVVYNKIQLFNLGMFGTNAMEKVFKRQNLPYYVVRYVDSKHEVAEFPRQYNQELICDFIDMAVCRKFDNQIDATIRDRYVNENFELKLTRKDLYNGN